MSRRIIIVALLLFFSLRLCAQNFDVVQLYYDVATFKLNNTQKHTLDSIIENFGNRRIIINGHSDCMGSELSNELISGQRANAVLRYLVDGGFPETQVISSIGLGQVNKNANKEPIHKEDASSRKVSIFITKGLLVKSKLKKVPVPEEKISVAPPPEKNNKFDFSKLKKNDIITLKKISFVPGSDSILPESYDELNNLYEALKANPTLKIKLEGHVCCSIYPDGYVEDSPNWMLSTDRALMVEELLIEKGIDSSRLSYEGFGRTRPIYETEANHAQEQINRRVEVRIIEK